jgi:hypothetical protein
VVSDRRRVAEPRFVLLRDDATAAIDARQGGYLVTAQRRVVGIGQPLGEPGRVRDEPIVFLIGVLLFVGGGDLLEVPIDDFRRELRPLRNVYDLRPAFGSRLDATNLALSRSCFCCALPSSMIWSYSFAGNAPPSLLGS